MASSCPWLKMTVLERENWELWLADSIRFKKKFFLKKHFTWAGGPALSRDGVIEPFSLHSYFCVLNSCLIFWSAESQNWKKYLCLPGQISESWPSSNAEFHDFKHHRHWNLNLRIRRKKKIIIGRKSHGALISQNWEMSQHQNQRPWETPKHGTCAGRSFFSHKRQKMKT